MTIAEQVICASAALEDRSDGTRFEVEISGAILPAFVVRYEGKVYAFVNQCAHKSLELDWSEGNFFDLERNLLICATHGARYHPATGECVGGLCSGRRLIRLDASEKDGEVYLTEQCARLV